MKDDLIRKMLAAVDSLHEDTTGLIRDLIRIRSYSGEEQEIVEFILEKMRQYGFAQVFSDGLGNAVGRVGKGPLRILMDAHIDTVRVSESENWRYPPFSGEIRQGCIYGRGAVDEKPAMAGFLMAIRAILSVIAPAELPFTLYVVGSVLEEDCDGYPLLHLVNNEGIRPDVVLLGEPTDLQVYRGQRGRMEIQIKTRGKAAHGAHNEQGVNAIYRMIPLVQQLAEMDRRLPIVPPLGKGSITVSQIASHGPSLCSVPDECMIHIDRRLTAGETDTSVLKELEQLSRDNGFEASIRIPNYEGKSWKGTTFTQEAYFPTWMLEETHPLVQAGLAAGKSALGRPVGSGFWGFSTNGVATAGRLNIPTIGFAPGKEELAHTAREELSLKDLHLAARFYALFPFMVAEKIGAIK